MTTVSPYDSSQSFLYKKAKELGVPARFVWIAPKSEKDARLIDSFDLEDNKDAIFTTLFEIIRKLVEEDPVVSLTQIWEIVSKSRGDSYIPLELIFIWLHAHFPPDIQVENVHLLQQVNSYLEFLNEPGRYKTMTDVINYYRTNWLPRYERELLVDNQTLQQYLKAQEEIGSIEPVAHGPVVVDTVKINYDYPVEPGINPLPDHFNKAKTSYVVPFIQLNVKQVKGQAEDVPRYYKIYKGKSIESRPEYNNIILTSTQAANAQSLYLNVWMGAGQTNVFDNEEEARTGKKESFDLVTISYLEQLNIIRVTFKSPRNAEVDEKVIIERIHRHIPDLVPPLPNQIRELRVSGNFVIYQVGLIDISLLHLIMNDPLFSTYLYLEESGKSFANKDRLNIRYRGASAELDEGKGYRTSEKGTAKNRAALSANVSQEIMEGGTSIQVVSAFGEVNTFKTPKSIPVLNIKINRAISRGAVDKFVNIMTRLIHRYTQYADQIKDYYLYLVPEYSGVLASKTEVILPKTVPETGGRIEESGQLSRNARLRKYASDIFVANYARRCQKERQPMLLLNPEEEEAWKQRLVQTPGGPPQQRQVMYFPRESHKYHLVCPDDATPYPGLQENKSLANRHTYPFIPCCFKLNQLNEPIVQAYYKGMDRPVKQAKPRKLHIIKGDKSLDPGRSAFIPPAISSFLSQYDPDAGTFYRYGVPRSTNSLIHCVAIARQMPAYLSAPNQEAWVSEVRDKIFEQGVKPESLRQELFDMTNEEIVRVTRDKESFFDPLLFYRAVELLFDCNIYIFSKEDKDPDTQKKISMLQLPRNRYFHVHPPNPNKPVVLIMRHHGGAADKLDYPQCELIVDQRSLGGRATEMNMLYGESMNSLMYSAISFVSRTITWQIFETPEPTLTARLNIYSNLNYPILFGQIPILAQFLDVAGKARLFILAPEVSPAGQFTDLRIFLNVPPTAPLNVPEFSVSQAKDNLPPYNKLIEFLGTPVGVTTTTNRQQLTGLWFPMGDVQFGFYAPCQDFSMRLFSEQFPTIPLDSESTSLTVSIPRGTQSQSQIQRISYLRKVAGFVDQIIRYLYLLSGIKDPTEFLRNNAIMYGPEKPDSTFVYNLAKIPRTLPGGTFQEVITAFSRQLPEMFIQGKIVLYDQQMYEGINFQLKTFAKEIEGLGITAAQRRQIQGFYSNKTDFSFDPKNEYILGSIREYNNWKEIYVPSASLQQRTAQNLKDNIQTKLSENAFAYQEPYIYQRSDNTTVGTSYDPRLDKFYQIQNVIGGDFKRAIRVALTWYEEKRNLGFTAEPYESPDGLNPAHIIYRISPGGGAIVKRNNSGFVNPEDAIALEILEYSDGAYHAAMLPIL